MGQLEALFVLRRPPHFFQQLTLSYIITKICDTVIQADDQSTEVYMIPNVTSNRSK